MHPIQYLQMPRRTRFSASVVLAFLLLLPLTLRAEAPVAKEPVDIGSRLELFVDDFLIDALSGDARRVMHVPQPREIIMEFGDYGPSWEAARGGAYPALIRDGERVRIYYSAAPRRPAGRNERTCVIESEDGIHFHRPTVGLHTVDGSTENNVVWPGNLAGHHFTPFIDTNPDVAPDARYKAFARGPGGMRFYASPDGYDWRLMDIEPNITPGPTDSQNVVFWDPVREHYVAYLRLFRSDSGLRPPEVDFYGRDADGNRVGGTHRCIRHAVSTNLVEWTETELVDYDDERIEQLYTNGIRPYDRAPHLYIGLPNRFVSTRTKVRGASGGRGINDALLMSSRDGKHFQRWAEAFLRPGTDRENWVNRNNYPALGMAQTSPTELSIYWNEHTRHKTKRMRRGTLRVDGFVSVNAGATGGELLTRPLRFDGDRLVVNYQTSANGEMRFELTDESGDPVPGFTFNESEQLFGNAVEHLVSWRDGADLADLAGRPVRLRVHLRDADLYAIRFEPAEAIRDRLVATAAEARALLADPLPAFARRCRDALTSAFEQHAARLARDPELTRQATLEGVFLIQRAVHRYRGCLRLTRRAGAALEQAGDTNGNTTGFGSLYHAAVSLLGGDLEAALVDRAVTAEGVRALAARLEGTLADLGKVAETAGRAGKMLADAAAVADEATGFGALYRARIAERKVRLHARLEDPRASLAAVDRATAALAEALARYRTVDAFAPVRPREIGALPASLTLGGASEWERGQGVNLLSADGALGIAFQPELVFPVETAALVRFPADAALQSPVMTVEAWVRLDNTHGQLAPVLRLGDANDSADIFRSAWTLRAHGGNFLFGLGSGDGDALVSLRTGRGANLRADSWHHVAASYDGRKARLYLDGELVDSADREGAIDHTHTAALVFGGHPGRRSADRFEGRLRDVRLWRTVRTEAEIREHMHRELTGREDGLAGLWVAGPRAGEGDQVFDLSGHGEPGRIQSARWHRNQGDRISDPIRLPDVDTSLQATLSWHADFEGDPLAAQLVVLNGFSDSAESLPVQWGQIENGDVLSCPVFGKDLGGKHLWLKTQFSVTDPAARISLHELVLDVCAGDAPK